MERTAHLRINPNRFKEDFEALAKIGATPEGGVHRPAFSDAHLKARAWFRGRVEEAGLEFRMDPAGNHSARLACAEAGAPALLLGSHLDSVPQGGRFDGALGVVAALEVLRVVQEAGLRLPFHLEAVDFTDEEGAVSGLLGSSALSGALKPEALQAPRGGRQALLDGLAASGLEEAGLLFARRDPVGLAGYLELHIEQGPRLVAADVQIGIVTGIVGIGSTRLVFLGQAGHAGATPMGERRDASQGAAGFILAARRLVLESFPDCVANTGAVHFEPGAFNIIPARAVVTLEYRAPQMDLLHTLGEALLAEARVQASRFSLELEVELLGEHPPAPMSPAAQAAIAAAAGRLGLEYMHLPSGAGHDAQSLATLCPSGMIFVPSVHGISHSPREYTSWEDCFNGANTLLLAALSMPST